MENIYTYEDVIVHNHIDSCWIVITNKVYDVTQFIKIHPGGDSILGLAGKDATVYFCMSHPTNVWSMPENYVIGRIYKPLFKTLPDAGFYLEAKEAVEKLYLNKRQNILFEIDSLIKIMAVASLYFVFIMSGNLFIGVLLGCTSFTCLAATNIHETGHGVFKYRFINKKVVEFISECFLGVSTASWRDQHFIHHNDTMNELDPDTNHHPIFRRNPLKNDSYMWYFKYQQYYMYILYCLLHIEGRIVDAKNMIWQMNITKKEKYWYCVSFCVFCCMFVVAPLSKWGCLHGLFMFMTYSICASICAAYVFNLNHLVDGVKFISLSDYDKYDIGEIQVVTSHNFTTRGFMGRIMCYVTGGLNFQIEHHLFPSFHSSFYPDISKIVKRLCSKYEIQYNESVDSICAHVKHWRFMKNLANPEPVTAIDTRDE